MLKVFCSQVILVVLVGKDILIEAFLFCVRELQMIQFSICFLRLAVCSGKYS